MGVKRMSQEKATEKTQDEKSSGLNSVLEKYRQEGRNALIPVLQEAQEIYGYLPKEVLEAISKGLKVPLSAIYGVVTFYAQFYLEKRGRNIVRVCRGTACHVRGGKTVQESVEEFLKLKEGETTPDYKFTLETVACLGACALSPVMMVNKNYYGKMNKQKAQGILKTY